MIGCAVSIRTKGLCTIFQPNHNTVKRLPFNKVKDRSKQLEKHKTYFIILFQQLPFIVQILSDFFVETVHFYTFIYEIQNMQNFNYIKKKSAQLKNLYLAIFII